MAQLPNAFNTEENSQSMEDRSALEKGDYIMLVKSSEMKSTSTGGQMLVLTFVVCEGPRKGAHVWIRLNLVNRSTQAMEIAYKTFNSICQAAGKAGVTDSDVIHNIPVQCSVVVTPEKDGYPEGNDIVAYDRAGGGMVDPGNATQEQTIATQPATQQDVATQASVVTQTAESVVAQATQTAAAKNAVASPSEQAAPAQAAPATKLPWE